MRLISVTDPKTKKETLMRVVSVTNAKSDAKPSLRQLIERRFKKVKLNLESLDCNGGNISIKQADVTHDKYGMASVVFNVGVPVKLSFNEDGLRVSAATVEFQLIAHNCYWNEGSETWQWNGDKDFRFHADEELRHVFATFRGKAVDIDGTGRWLEKGGLGRWDDTGIATALIVAVMYNTPKEDIKQVLSLALSQE